MRIRSLIAWSLGALVVAGCAHSTAPHDWLPSATQAGERTLGGWVSIDTRAKSKAPSIEGEFIAIQSDSVFVLSAGELRAIPFGEIGSATVSAYDIPWDRLAAWTLAGTISTVSHGFGLLLSAPVWILTGSIVTSHASKEPLHRVPRESWQDVSRYARFPQGLPPTIDRGSLTK
jgi:hypothetical protein